MNKFNDEEEEEFDENEELDDGEELDNSDQADQEEDNENNDNGNDKFKKFKEIATKKGDMKVKPVNNDHYDIAYEMNESVEDDHVHIQKGGPHKTGDSKIGVRYEHNVDKLNYEGEEEEEEEDDNHHDFIAKNKMASELQIPNQINKNEKLPHFDFSEFKNLNVAGDIKELLNIMNKFDPQEIELDIKLKPYIPSYIPAIGEVDAFLKMNRPDNLIEELGLSVLDEPTITGVDPSIFSLELSYKLKSKTGAGFIVKSIESAEKNPNKIQTWIEQVANLHKEKMSSSVSYSKQMPNIESLMQIWPDKMENTLKELNFPNESLNIGLDNYSKLVCNMVDIPIHNLKSNKAIIEALHVFFTLYSEFKENQHFQRQQNKKAEDNVQTMKFY